MGEGREGQESRRERTLTVIFQFSPNSEANRGPYECAFGDVTAPAVEIRGRLWK